MDKEILNFKKYYKWYVIALVLAIIATLGVYYLTNAQLTTEFVIAVFFISFLSSIVYMGALIIQLQKELDEVKSLIKENGLRKPKKK